jgi:hypothetical protein
LALVSAVFVLVFVFEVEVELEEKSSGISKYDIIAGGNLPLPLLLWPTMIQFFVPSNLASNRLCHPSDISCFAYRDEVRLSDNVLYGALG